MKLIEKQSYLFQNRGIPHENNLNMIGMALTSRKIIHKVPVSVDFEPEAYVKACAGDTKEVMIDVQELWNAADALGLKYKRVEAEVLMMPRQYKIIFYCYGD